MLSIKKRERIGTSLTPPPQFLPPLRASSPSAKTRSLRRRSRDNIVKQSTELAQFVRIEGPYLTFDMIKRTEAKVMSRKESKKRWLSRKGFNAAIKCKPNFIPNYVQASPAANPSTHQFREFRKEKWLAGDFKPGRYSSFRFDEAYMH